MEWKHGHPQQTCEKQLNAFWPLRKRLDVVPSEAESSLLGAFLCKSKEPTTAAGNMRYSVRPSRPGSRIVIVSADARDGPSIRELPLDVGDCACKETGTGTRTLIRWRKRWAVGPPKLRPDQTRPLLKDNDITDTSTTSTTTTTAAMAAKSYKQEKEAWVSGHMGGSVADVNSVSFAMPVPYTWHHARADVLLTTTSS
jgi:hypothetical protein